MRAKRGCERVEGPAGLAASRGSSDEGALRLSFAKRPKLLDGRLVPLDLIAHAAKRLHDPSTISSLMIRNPRAVRMSTSVQNYALLRDRRQLFFADGPLAGLKLIGFAFWERRQSGAKRHVPRASAQRERRASELRPAAAHRRLSRAADRARPYPAGVRRPGAGVVAAWAVGGRHRPLLAPLSLSTAEDWTGDPDGEEFDQTPWFRYLEETRDGAPLNPLAEF